MNTKIIIICFVLLTACTLGREEVDPADNAKNIGFETGWQGLGASVNGPNFQREIIDTVARNGSCSAYHAISYGDQTYRSESYDWDNAPVIGEEWYGISIYLPGDYETDIQSEIVLQWHGRQDPWETGRCPPLALLTANGQWQVIYRSDPFAVSMDTRGLQVTYESLGSYQDDLETWVDWVYYVKWDYRGNGALKIWKNGMIVMDLDQIAIGYNDLVGCYIKFGLYKWDWKQDPGDVTSRSIYHDNYWRGADRVQ